MTLFYISLVLGIIAFACLVMGLYLQIYKQDRSAKYYIIVGVFFLIIFGKFISKWIL